MKKLTNILISLAFMVCSSAVIAGPAVIYSGTAVKTLKDQLKLKDTASILTGSDDPTAVAKDASKGSLYLRQGAIGEAYVKQDDGSSTNWQLTPTVGTLDLDDVLVDAVGTPTYTSAADILDTTGSSGLTSGGGITDNGDGTIDIAAGTGLFRTTDSRVGHIVSGDWSAVSSQALTDNSENYINIDYNSGTPIITVGTTSTEDHHTSNLIALVYREGTTLHINEQAGRNVSDAIDNVIDRLKQAEGTAHESGAAISEVGTRNLAVTSGTFWMGLNHFDTNAFDSSAAGTWDYFYRDGGGGWTEVTGQTQIDNLQYDDNSGTLATLANSRYGVHWVYMEVDSDVGVVYGQDSYTSTQAQDAQPPSGTPPHFGNNHSILIGKIVIGKNDATFTSIDSAFDTVFVGTGATDHNDLANLQGGAATEYFHTTSAQHAAIVGLGNNFAVTSDGSGNLASSAVTATELGYVSGVTSAIQTQFTGKADTDLNNLANPTDINQSLIPNSSSQLLGSAANRWGILYSNAAHFYTSGSNAFSVTALNLPTGPLAYALGSKDTFDLNLITIDEGTLNAASEDILLATGNVTNGNGVSGDIKIRTGAIDTGTRGDIVLEDGTQGTAGYIFTSKDNSGSGEWARPPTGEINYITNDKGRFDTSGWAESTSGQVDITQTSTAADLPREVTSGTGLKIIGTGSTGTNEYVSFAFTLDDADASKKLKIEWDQKPISGYAAGELDVVIYDVTNTTEINPSTQDIHTGTHFLSSFDATTSLSYELRIRKPLAATTNGIVISNVIVGPGKIVTGATVEADTTFTPTGNFTTNTTYSGSYRRVGNWAHIRIRLDFSGAPNVTALKLDMPTGLTIDASALGSPSSTDWPRIGDGSYHIATVSTKVGLATVAYDTTTTVNTLYNYDVTASSVNSIVGWPMSSSSPGALANGDEMEFNFSVPIAEWAGSGTTNLGTNDVEYAYNSSTSTSSDTTSFAYGPTGANIAAFAPSGTASIVKRVQFQNTIQDKDSIVLEINTAGSVWVPFESRLGSFATNDAGSTYYNTLVTRVSDTQLDVGFYSKSSPTTAWSALSAWKWRVKKTRSGIAVGFSAATADQAGLVKTGKHYGSAYSLPATNINTSNVTFYTFTAPNDGVFNLTGNFSLSNAQATGSSTRVTLKHSLKGAGDVSIAVVNVTNTAAITSDYSMGSWSHTDLFLEGETYVLKLIATHATVIKLSYLVVTETEVSR